VDRDREFESPLTRRAV